MRASVNSEPGGAVIVDPPHRSLVTFMPAPMERLPVELLDLVVHCLTLPNYQSLRLVSRQIYALTLSTFSSRYFSKRTTTLSTPSLARLLQVSASHLSPSVSLLDIKLLNHEDYQSLYKISRVGIYPPPKRFQQVANIRPQDISREYALFDHMRLNDDPKDVVRSLGHALEQLSQVRTVRLRVNDETLQSNFPGEQDEEEEYSMFVHACFRAIIAAIIRSGAKLHDFSVIKGTKVRPSTKSANLIHPAFKFSFPMFLSLSKAFSSLRSLRLSIRTDYHGNSRVPGWQNGISQFIATASALEELTICFPPTDTEPAFKAAVMQSLASSLDLPKLKIMQLYGSVVDEQALSNFAKVHSSLRQITLTDVRLLNGSWSAYLRTCRASLNLETLRLAFLQQSEVPRDIWWNRGNRRKSKLVMDTTDNAEQRSMNEMLTEAIDYLDLISTLPDGYALPYAVLLAYPHNHQPNNPP